MHAGRRLRGRRDARLAIALFSLLLAACAGIGTGGLLPGHSGVDDVIRALGQPALEWREADGSRRLAFPRGPMGVHTYMARVGPDGRLRDIDNVLEPAVFARVTAGMSEDDVLRTLGPPVPGWTIYFPARDERVWEWRYCDEWNQLARFEVLFDGGRRTVRSTMSLREDQIGACGGADGGCWCAH